MTTTTETQAAPDYGMFTKRPGGSGRPAIWDKFLESLEAGVPVRVPDIGTGKRDVSSLHGLFAPHTKRLGIRVALRTFDGVPWACRLKDEDAK